MDDREAYLERIGELVDRAAYRQALKVCNQAIGAHPDCVEAHDYLGIILCRMGRYPEALPAYDRAISIEPEFLPALLDKAELLVYHLQESESAIALTDRVLRIGAQDVDGAHAHYLKAIAYANLGLHAEAVENHDLAIEIEPDYPDSHCERGVSLFECYRFSDALRGLKAAVAVDSDYARPHHFLGCLYEYMGEDDLARREHARAAEIDAENYPVPIELSPEDFARAIQEAIHVLPRQVARALAGTRVDVERLPDRMLLARRHVRPSALTTRQNAHDRAGEDRLIVFQRCVEWLARNRAQVVDEVAHAIAHELGHPERA